MPSVFTITLVQVLVGIVLFLALLNGQRDLTVLSLLVLGILGGARVWARLSLRGLRCGWNIDKCRIFPDERPVLRVNAENAKLLPIWMKINLPIGNLVPNSSAESVLTKQTSLLWYQRTRFQWELIARRRGVYPLGPLDIVAGDLFSFFSRRMQEKESQSLIVYPRLVSLNPVPLPGRDFFGLPEATSPVQDPVYILGTRDYQQGRPSRFIHWKASARHQRLQEKVFEPTVQAKVLLVVDVDPFAKNEAEDDFERTLEVVASLAVRLDRQGRSMGLVAGGAIHGGGEAVVRVARNDQQLASILEVLARLERKTDRDLKDLLRRGLADAWGVSCVYFSLEEDEALLAASDYLAQRRTPVTFCVCRRREPAGEPTGEMPDRVYSLDSISGPGVEIE